MNYDSSQYNSFYNPIPTQDQNSKTFYTFQNSQNMQSTLLKQIQQSQGTQQQQMESFNKTQAISQEQTIQLMQMFTQVLGNQMNFQETLTRMNNNSFPQQQQQQNMSLYTTAQQFPQQQQNYIGNQQPGDQQYFENKDFYERQRMLKNRHQIGMKDYYCSDEQLIQQQQYQQQKYQRFQQDQEQNDDISYNEQQQQSSSKVPYQQQSQSGKQGSSILKKKKQQSQQQIQSSTLNKTSDQSFENTQNKDVSTRQQVNENVEKLMQRPQSAEEKGNISEDSIDLEEIKRRKNRKKRNKNLYFNPDSDAYNIKEALERKKAIVALQNEIDKIYSKLSGTHENRCQGQHYAEQIEFLQYQQNQIMNRIEKDKEYQNKFMDHLRQTGGDAEAYLDMLKEREDKENRAWNEYLDRFNRQKKKGKGKKSWQKDFDLNLGHKSNYFRNNYLSFKTQKEWREEFEKHQEKLRKIYGTDSKHFYQGDDRIKSIRKMEQEIKEKFRQDPYSQHNRSNSQNSQQQNQYEENDEINDTRNPSHMHNQSKSYKSISQSQQAKREQEQSRVIREQFSSKYDVDSKHFSRCMEPHLNSSQFNQSSATIKAQQYAQRQRDLRRRQNADYMHATGIKHLKQHEVDYLAKNISDKLQDLREIKKQIRPVVRPKEFTALDERVYHALEGTNLCCKGCIKFKLAKQIKTITDHQINQLAKAEDQVQNQEHYFRMLQKDIGDYYRCLEDLDEAGIKENKISRQRLKQLQEEWQNFEMCLKDNKVQTLVKQYKQKQTEEILSQHCPECMRISLLPKLKVYEQMRKYNRKNKDTGLQDLREKGNVDEEVEDQVIRKQFQQTFTAEDLEYRGFIEKLARKVRNLQRQEKKQYSYKKDFVAINRDKLSTQEPYIRESTKYTKNYVDSYERNARAQKQKDLEEEIRQQMEAEQYNEREEQL